jgi:hypothetical protein
MEYAHNRPCKPATVTNGEFTAALSEMEVAHQKNTDFLTNPYPAVNPAEFHDQARTAQQLAQNLSSVESRGMLPVANDLSHGQEVILYATSRLRAALTEWIDVIKNDVEYEMVESRAWWINALMFEMVSDRSVHIYWLTLV